MSQKMAALRLAARRVPRTLGSRSFTSSALRQSSVEGVNSIGVIGAGQMGLGIALVAARQANLPVTLVDTSQSSLDKSLVFLQKLLDKDVSKSRLTQSSADTIKSLITPSTSLSSLTDTADFIIEAVPEIETLKLSIFRDLGAAAKPTAILATNTSSISITKIAAAAGPAAAPRVIATHFMNPVPIQPGVEIITALQTSPETLSTALALTTAMGKTPSKSADTPGFIANRILMPYINEAVICLETGVAAREDIDAMMKNGTNVPMGPLQLADFIGLDTCLAIMGVLYRDTGDSKYRPSVLLQRMVDAGWVGKKCGRGFYEYNFVAVGGGGTVVDCDCDCGCDCGSTAFPFAADAALALLTSPVKLHPRTRLPACRRLLLRLPRVAAADERPRHVEGLLGPVAAPLALVRADLRRQMAVHAHVLAHPLLLAAALHPGGFVPDRAGAGAGAGRRAHRRVAVAVAFGLLVGGQVPAVLAALEVGFGDEELEVRVRVAELLEGRVFRVLAVVKDVFVEAAAAAQVQVLVGGVEEGVLELPDLVGGAEEALADLGVLERGVAADGVGGHFAAEEGGEEEAAVVEGAFAFGFVDEVRVFAEAGERADGTREARDGGDVAVVVDEDVGGGEPPILEDEGPVVEAGFGGEFGDHLVDEEEAGELLVDGGAHVRLDGPAVVVFLCVAVVEVADGGEVFKGGGEGPSICGGAAAGERVGVVDAVEGPDGKVVVGFGGGLEGTDLVEAAGGELEDDVGELVVEAAGAVRVRVIFRVELGDGPAGEAVEEHEGDADVVARVALVGEVVDLGHGDAGVLPEVSPGGGLAGDGLVDVGAAPGFWDLCEPGDAVLEGDFDGVVEGAALAGAEGGGLAAAQGLGELEEGGGVDLEAHVVLALVAAFGALAADADAADADGPAAAGAVQRSHFDGRGRDGELEAFVERENWEEEAAEPDDEDSGVSMYSRFEFDELGGGGDQNKLMESVVWLGGPACRRSLADGVFGVLRSELSIAAACSGLPVSGRSRDFHPENEDQPDELFEGEEYRGGDDDDVIAMEEVEERRVL
ncbi:LOW QUALITY PROTEIN: Lambda-crystallin [Drechslerella dactyloides]|uniref:Lambda-crystallin n=1 Tax=Drechslerella dactyloides TaxID=74499 RepID=A0AAD6ISM4_DREDA|nr:LOW QUALITY PROTEIN: Lambda-crystallin [Drechslerella dactyloides]